MSAIGAGMKRIPSKLGVLRVEYEDHAREAWILVSRLYNQRRNADVQNYNVGEEKSRGASRIG